MSHHNVQHLLRIIGNVEKDNKILRMSNNDKDAEIARLRLDYELTIDDYNRLQDHYDAVLKRAEEAEAQVVELARLGGAVLYHDERGQGVGYLEAMDAMKMAFASLPARAKLAAAVIEAAVRYYRAREDTEMGLHETVEIYDAFLTSVAAYQDTAGPGS